MTRSRLIFLIRLCTLLAVCVWLYPVGMAWLPWALFMPVFAAAGPACGSCNGGTGPDSMIVTFSGWANRNCDGCGSLDGTFLLTSDGPSSCNYTGAGTIGCTVLGGPQSITIFGTWAPSGLCTFGSTRAISCGADSGGFCTAVWGDTPSVPYDCGNSGPFSQLNGSLNGFACNATSVTASIA